MKKIIILVVLVSFAVIDFIKGNDMWGIFWLIIAEIRMSSYYIISELKEDK